MNRQVGTRRNPLKDSKLYLKLYKEILKNHHIDIFNGAKYLLR